MLAGSGSKKVQSKGLQKLSTFGLLQPAKLELITELLDWLLAIGRLTQTQTAKFRPVIDLTPPGREWLRGQFTESVGAQIPLELANRLSATFKGRSPRGGTAEPPPPRTEGGQVESSPPSRAASGANEVSAMLDSVPVIARPADPSAPAANASPPPPKPPAPPLAVPPSRIRVDLPHPSARQPTWFWTWRLLADGYAWNQIGAVRNLACEEVLDHLAIAAREKKPMDLAVLFGDLWREGNLDLKAFLEQAATTDPSKRDILAQAVQQLCEKLAK